MRRIIAIVSIYFLTIVYVLGNNTDLLLKSYSCYQQRKYSEAIEHFSLLLNEATTGIEQIQFDRAVCYYSLNDLAKARKDFQKLADNNNKEANLYLAKIFSQWGIEQDMYFYLERYMVNNSNAKPELIKNDTAFEKYNQNKQWETFWENKEVSQEYLLYADIEFWIAKERWQMALDKIGFAPANSKTQLYQSKVYAGMGDLPAAFTFINQAISQDNTNTDYLLYKAHLLLKNSKNERAVEVLKKVVELCPYQFEAYALLTQASLKSAPEEAVQYAELLMKYFPENAEYCLLATKAYLEATNSMQALKVVNKAFKLKPPDAALYTLRGKVYLSMNTYQQAANDFAMSLDQEPSDAETYYCLGETFYKIGNHEKACYNWGKAVELGHTEAIKKQFNLCGE